MGNLLAVARHWYVGALGVTVSGEIGSKLALSVGVGSGGHPRFGCFRQNHGFCDMWAT